MDACDGTGRGLRLQNGKKVALVLVVTAAICGLWSRTAVAAVPFPTKACKALQAKYPGLKGKTLVDALNPHTPGYEALDPQDPSKYVGFDVDLGAGAGTVPGIQPDVQARRLRGFVADAAERAGRPGHL